MKANKKFCAIVCVMLLCVSVLLGACGNEQASGTANSASSTEAEYRVTVVDGSGNPYGTGIIVQFMQNGEKVALQAVDENGVAAKTLTKGDYTVELLFTGNADDYYYDPAGLTLSAEQTEIEVVLAMNVGAETKKLYVNGEEFDAYYVSTGSTYVDLDQENRSYFLFVPTVAGNYQFSISDPTATIGYYGAPHFVQSISAAEVVDNTFTSSVKASMIGTDAGGTTVLVIGIDAGDNDNCVLTVERIGDPIWDPSDEPWTIYQATVELAPYTLPAGAKLADFDL